MLARTLLIAASLVVSSLGACDDDPDNLLSTEVERRQSLVSAQGASTSGADTTDAPPDVETPDTTTGSETTGPTGTTADTAIPDPDTTTEDTTVADTRPDTGPDDTSAPLHPATYPPDRVHSPITPSVVARLQQISAVDPALQDDVFMKVGASTTVSAGFFKCFGGTNYDLGVYTHLASTLAFFLEGDADGGNPFSRASLAAKSGVSARWAIDGDPSPLELEYLATSPRYAFIHYGTNDMGLGQTYQSALFPFVENLWTIVDDLLAWGVVPTLATILHRLDNDAADLWVTTYNGAIAALAQGRQVPLVDLYLAYETLPGYGLGSDGLHSSSAPEGACHLTDSGLEYGYNTRNLHMLTLLSRLEASVLDGEPHDPPGPAPIGLGTIDDPIVITSLPYYDLQTTVDAPSQELDLYTGCSSSTDEGGRERVYRIDVATPTRLRASVHDRGETDIDLHLLDETASEQGCLARAHQFIETTLAPGTYHFVLDTFVSNNGTARSGEYLLSIVPCPADDPTCG